MTLGIKGRIVDLYVKFLDAAGNAANTDDTPTVSITDAGGTLLQDYSNVGISLFESPGIYKLSYNIPYTANDGYALATWTANIGADTVTSAFLFLITSSGSVAAIDEPTFVPGDDIAFEFSQEEVHGLNLLMKILRIRLKNDGTRQVPDGVGGYTSQACSIFSNEELTCFLVNSLSEFNQIPHFSNFTFADPNVYGIFADVILQGAVLLALAAQALIEKGREFVITDNGLTFQPPAVSELLNTQYTAQLADYKEKVKYIKCSLKPTPLGLGCARPSAVAPAYLRLRHLRSRQII